MNHTQRYRTEEHQYKTTNSIFYESPDSTNHASTTVYPAGQPGSVCAALVCSEVPKCSSTISSLLYHQKFSSTGRIKPAAYGTSSQLFFGSHRLADTYQVKAHDRVRPAPQQYRAWMAEYSSKYIDPKVRALVSGSSLHALGRLLSVVTGSC
jgi:hypothetical protein